MDLVIFMLGAGFLLSIILLVLLIALASILSHKNPLEKRKKVRQDMKKIKEQVNGEE